MGAKATSRLTGDNEAEQTITFLLSVAMETDKTCLGESEMFKTGCACLYQL